jgi:DNA-binding beta-propeller fold protein YncE
MIRRPQRLLAAALVAATVGCAHAPPPAKPLPEVVWPEPPAPPRLRLVAVLPAPDAPPPPRSFWSRLADAVTGTDSAEEARRQLVRPFGVAVGPDGTVFVADPDLPGLVRTDAAGVSESVTCRGRAWGSPIAVALGEQGDLLVADAGTAEVVRIAPNGACRAVGAGALERPTGVAELGGHLLVADPPRHQIVVLSAEGAVLGRWGGHGSGEGELNFPTAIARASDGTVLVVDALNFRIVRLAPDGRTAGSFGTAGDSGGELARPKGVATDGAGRIYVSDADRDAVLVFDAAGRFEYAAGSSGAGPGFLQHPAGLAIARDRLFVADSHNARVVVFQILGGST